MCKRRLLIIEDLPEKAEEVRKVVFQNFPNIEIVEKSSYHSAIEEIYLNHQEYFLILLDISMSTYDVNVEENGGLPEALAGKRILEGMFLRDIPTKVLVVTMYESFDGKSINELDAELRDDNPDSYDGFIFFSFKKSEWKKQLVDYIKSKNDKDFNN